MAARLADDVTFVLDGAVGAALLGVRPALAVLARAAFDVRLLAAAVTLATTALLAAGVAVAAAALFAATGIAVATAMAAAMALRHERRGKPQGRHARKEHQAAHDLFLQSHQ
jgi:hypothetical protein